jgi:hypothetical protein
MFSGFHENEKTGKVYDARHVGIGKFDSAFGVKFVSHDFLQISAIEN